MAKDCVKKSMWELFFGFKDDVMDTKLDYRDRAKTAKFAANENKQRFYNSLKKK